jgi:error-prone DNA polymerase
MYGFPESHAASFALIAYASAYLKVHYLAAFTCGLLNNQPMGFYSPAVLIKDAQRHGLRVRPMDVQRSDWLCTLEPEHDGSLSLRIGFNYAKGLRQSSAIELLAARSRDGIFQSVDELALRVPALNRGELVALAQIGALNSLGKVEHRRDALWQVEQAGRPVGPLLRGADSAHTSDKDSTPLQKMTTDERLAADYMGTGLTTGPHPMAYHRELSGKKASCRQKNSCRDAAINLSASPAASSPASAPAQPRASSFSPSKTKPASPTSSSHPMYSSRTASLSRATDSS